MFHSSLRVYNLFRILFGKGIKYYIYKLIQVYNRSKLANNGLPSQVGRIEYPQRRLLGWHQSHQMDHLAYRKVEILANSAANGGALGKESCRMTLVLYRYSTRRRRSAQQRNISASFRGNRHRTRMDCTPTRQASSQAGDTETIHSKPFAKVCDTL